MLEVFKNAKIVNVFTGEILESHLAVEDGRVLGWGDYSGAVEYDLAGKYVCPGFIDGHVHLESAMVTPREFARAVVPLGTTTVIADPHEIANVCGVEGVEYMLAATEGLPLNVYVMLPSCVPSTVLDVGGATLGGHDLALLAIHRRVLGLGEVMDFNSVLQNQPDVSAKLELFRGMVIDGHAPGLQGKDLHRYVFAGMRSDHECVTAAEAHEKLSLGMHLMIREGSACKNLLALLPAVTPHTSRRAFFVTDDRHPALLLQEGHINHLVRMAVAAGLNPVVAIQMATINTAEYFGLKTLGALAPGYDADFLVLDNLHDFRPSRVYKRGILVAEHGRALHSTSDCQEPRLACAMKIAPLTAEMLCIPAPTPVARVIGLIPGQVVTSNLQMRPLISQGFFVADVVNDVLKLAVIDRHHKSGSLGLALVSGFGLTRGAMASSVAHDAHNVVVLGTNDADIIMAVQEIERLGGGVVLVSDGQVLARVALPLAGLLSFGSMEDVAAALQALNNLAHAMGVKEGHDPFMILSFLALPVIPELKLTSRGLVDVPSGTLVSTAVVD
ncbi:MAG: Adenine deaminase [Firmicutes bacterium]|nr:Adenine deaminase [Bacillota bacterium]